MQLFIRWARYRYKRYRNNLTKDYKWLDRVRIQYPSLFYHWPVGGLLFQRLATLNGLI
ncbi:hypothetical protein [Cyclobacterium amurskyense]|uniref:Uncharacterized protein n=1 Tax=Cyclobacterium amurskyense TaxID=320787 RepID=A0A0H4PCN5_9BACT|nr:hypothetical protein [Cyclobacterium amurskyense]AKP50900.1 hypothetical protein CA2015_1461 [Cyclobacterium amurskyense]